MTDSPTWDAYSTHLVICPGLTWEEWAEKWATVDQTNRAIKWWCADALIYGENNFPDQWTQMLDAEYAEQHREAMRVARRIPPADRVEGLSWSVHREVAACDPEERNELLALAKAQGWGTRQLVEERKRRKEAAEAYPRNGAPEHRELEADSTVESTQSTAPLSHIAELREKIAALRAGEVPNLTEWLDEIAALPGEWIIEAKRPGRIAIGSGSFLAAMIEAALAALISDAEDRGER